MFSKKQIQARTDKSFNGFILSQHMYGDDTNNVLYGEANFFLSIHGMGGDDIIYGGRQNSLFGDAGNDVLIGAAGDLNFFYGGAGYDTIVLDDWSFGYFDIIQGFNAAQDKIQLDGSHFTGLAEGMLSKDLFYIGEKGKGIWRPGAEDRILYDKTSKDLYYKTEAGTLVHIADVVQETGTPSLSHLNFFIA